MHHPGLAPIRESDIQIAVSRFKALVDFEDREASHILEDLLTRITTQNWSVEWNLPRWLGSRFDMPEAVQRELVLANVFGLAYVRLRDDRVDRESPAISAARSRELEEALMAQASRIYRGLIGPTSIFWTHFDHSLQRWREAKLPRVVSPDFSVGELESLAEFGAPLYISCAAAHALADTDMPLESLIQPVEGYLSAAVLYDHLKDWRADISAGRPNLFCQAILTDDQPAERETLIARMQMEYLRQDRLMMYCETIFKALVQAAASAQTVGLTQFAQHLNALEGEARSSSERMLRGVKRFIEQAAIIN